MTRTLDGNTLTLGNRAGGWFGIGLTSITEQLAMGALPGQQVWVSQHLVELKPSDGQHWKGIK